MQPLKPSHSRVAYLISQYPAISHTFIEREVAALRAEGVDVTTYTVRPCPTAEFISTGMRSEAARTQSLIGSSTLQWVRAHAALLIGSPAAYFGALARALRTGRGLPRDRLWQLFYFAEAVLLHDLMTRAGLHHVHAHMTNVASDVARLTADIGRRRQEASWRWSLTIHGPDDFWMIEPWDVAAKLADADAVSCISDYCGSQVMRLLPPTQWSKVHKVHMSVDTDRYSAPDGGRVRPPGDPLRILYVGRLVPQKGGPVLLTALSRLQHDGVATRCIFIGSGPIRDDLEAQATQLGLDVAFLGSVGQDGIVSHYRWADVFVLPSFQEGLPVVLMEAMATELPVVATQITGIPELVHDGKNGLLVPAGRADRLSDAIGQLANDPLLRARLGEAARRSVEEDFTASTTGPSMSSFLIEAMA